MTYATLVVQLLNGLASASSLFLVAAGLTLIFGVTRVINFAHGSFFMLGAYVAYSAGGVLTDALGHTAAAFFVAVALAGLAVCALGTLLEVAILKRLYAAPELLQLTATFAVVLIVRDATLAYWGAEDRLGPRVPHLAGTVSVLGQAVPQYDLLLIVVSPIVLIALTLLVTRTRFGVLVRAASENRALAAALGVDEARLFTLVFALGAFLAGLAGGLQLPREPANLGMDLTVVADAFVVTVIGGLGSIPGAFVAALLIGITKALCIATGTVQGFGFDIAFPKLTLVVEFVIMAIVLALRPYGLLGMPMIVAQSTALPEQRAFLRAPGRRDAAIAVALLAAAALLPLAHDSYALVLATDILIAALFTASLQLLTGTGGMTSFGHAAYFGIGTYAAALAARAGWPFALALGAAPVCAMLAAMAFGALCVRLSGVYLAMLTLAFAQIVWSIAWQWDAVTGGSNGIVGVWPPQFLAERTHYYWFALACIGIALIVLVRIGYAPFGRSLRATRDSPTRAAALGIPVAARRWLGFALAGGFAGFAGGLYAYAKGSVSPETLAIPHSVDAIVMLLLGGLNALFGPLLGAATLVWLQDTLSRNTEYWRAFVGIGILILVIAFPQGLGGTWNRFAHRQRRSTA